MNIGKKLLNMGERAVSTFAEQFLTVMLVSSGVGAASQHWAYAASTAAFSGLMSLGTSLLTFGIPKLPDWADASLRVVKTGLQVFLGTLAASKVTDIIHVDWKSALAAGVAVMLPATLKVLATLGNSKTDGAALIPAKLASDALPVDSLNYGTDQPVQSGVMTSQTYPDVYSQASPLLPEDPPLVTGTAAQVQLAGTPQPPQIQA